MFSLLLRNLFFTIVQPGLVAGLFPYWIIGGDVKSRLNVAFQSTQVTGVIVFLVGLVVMLSCIARFAFEGRGTLSPADPTKRLVIGGLYKLSRNPMYVGVMLILIGEALVFQSVSLGIYGVFIFLAFHVFILLHEEPRLEADFGEDYSKYRKKVRRWI